MTTIWNKVRCKDSVPFKDRVLAVLEQKGYKKQCPALEMFIEKIEYNKKNACRKVQFNKYPGLFLLTSIPIISALLSALIGLNDHNYAWIDEYVFPISLALTLCTILNSIFKPHERFQTACKIGIKINSFEIALLLELERLESLEDSSLLDFINNKKDEFENYQRMLIDLFLPEKANAQQTAPADA
jgi:hypothetical protein